MLCGNRFFHLQFSTSFASKRIQMILLEDSTCSCTIHFEIHVQHNAMQWSIFSICNDFLGFWVMNLFQCANKVCVESVGKPHAHFCTYEIIELVLCGAEFQSESIVRSCRQRFKAPHIWVHTSRTIHSNWIVAYWLIGYSSNQCISLLKCRSIVHSGKSSIHCVCKQ